MWRLGEQGDSRCLDGRRLPNLSALAEVVRAARLGRTRGIPRFSDLGRPQHPGCAQGPRGIDVGAGRGRPSACRLRRLALHHGRAPRLALAGPVERAAARELGRPDPLPAHREESPSPACGVSPHLTTPERAHREERGARRTASSATPGRRHWPPSAHHPPRC
jgi:hypothetical protein